MSGTPLVTLQKQQHIAVIALNYDLLKEDITELLNENFPNYMLDNQCKNGLLKPLSRQETKSSQTRKAMLLADIVNAGSHRNLILRTSRTQSTRFQMFRQTTKDGNSQLLIMMSRQWVLRQRGHSKSVHILHQPKHNRLTED